MLCCMYPIAYYQQVQVTLTFLHVMYVPLYNYQWNWIVWQIDAVYVNKLAVP